MFHTLTRSERFKRHVGEMLLCNPAVPGVAGLGGSQGRDEGGMIERGGRRIERGRREEGGRIESGGRED